MPTYEKLHSITLIAAGAVSAARLIGRTGAHAASTSEVVGISEQAAADGRAFSAITSYSGLVEAAGIVPTGAPVKPAPDGSGRAVIGTDDDNCGWALSPATQAGGIVSVRLLERSKVLKQQATPNLPWSVTAVGGFGSRPARAMKVRGFAEGSDLTITPQDANITVATTYETVTPLGCAAMKLAIVNTGGAARTVQIQCGATGMKVPNFKATKRRLVCQAAFSDAAKVAQFELYYGTTGLGRFVRARRFPNQIGVNRNVYAFHGGIVNATFGVVADTLLDADTVEQWRMVIYVNAGQTVDAYIDGLYMPDRDLPFVVFTMDDNDASMMTYGQILNSRGLKATFGINSAEVGQAGHVTWTQVGELRDAGNEIGDHNVNNSSLTDLGTVAAYMAEHRTMKNDLYFRGLHNAPYYHPLVKGATSDALASALLAEGVVIQRAVSDDFCEPLFRDRHLTAIPVRGFGSGTQLGDTGTVGTMAYYLQLAKDFGIDMPTMAHKLGASYADNVTYPIADFTTFVDSVVAGIQAGTIGGAGCIGDWCRYRGYQVL